MPKSDMVEKKIILVDGEELEGLVNIDEYIIQDDVVDIPGMDKSVPVANGVRKIPPVNAVYKVTRNSSTLKRLQNWYYKKENHDITLIRTDGTGQEFKRELWPNVQVSKCHAPAYDSATPTFAQVLVTFLPEDIIPIEAEA